jgi:hypothetical protein
MSGSSDPRSFGWPATTPVAVRRAIWLVRQLLPRIRCTTALESTSGFGPTDSLQCSVDSIRVKSRRNFKFVNAYVWTGETYRRGLDLFFRSSRWPARGGIENEQRTSHIFFEFEIVELLDSKFRASSSDRRRHCCFVLWWLDNHRSRAPRVWTGFAKTNGLRSPHFSSSFVQLRIEIALRAFTS